MNNDNIRIETYNKLNNGQIKYKGCGATDISFNQTTGMLKCNYCRSEFKEYRKTGERR